MFKSADPGGGKRRPASWSHEKLKGGGVVSGWKAGEVVWVWVHYVGRSVPCHHEMTGGDKPCPWCAKRPRVDLVGYLPMYDLSGKPLVVIVQEYSRDILAGIKLHEPVVVRRGKERGDPVCVGADKGRAKYAPSSPARLDPADIRSWLLRLWKDDVFAGYWSEMPRDDIGPALDRAKAAVVEERDATRELANRIKEKLRIRETTADDNGPSLIGDVLPLVPKPSRNGTHADRKTTEDDAK